MAFADTAGRSVMQGLVSVRLVLTGAVKQGDLVGYNAGWVKADANGALSGQFVAAEDGAVGDTINAFRIAVLKGPTGMTAGGKLYASDTAGGYSQTPSTTSPQPVGVAVSATEGLVELNQFRQRWTESFIIAAANIASVLYVAPVRCRVIGISERHVTVSTAAATFTVERLQGTEAPGEGDDLLGETKIDANATANTVQSPALTDTAASLVLEGGDCLCILVATGDITDYAAATLAVAFEPA